MAKDIQFTPLLQKVPLFMGFLAGSLIVAGLANPWGAVQIVLLLGGVFVFIDGVIPDGDVSIVATFLAAILGGFVSLLGSVAGFSVPWAAFIVVVTVVYYLMKFSRRGR